MRGDGFNAFWWLLAALVAVVLVIYLANNL